LLAQQLAQQQLAQYQLGQNPWAQQQFAQQSPWPQSPPLTAGLQNPLLNPMLAYYGWQQLQQQQLQQQQQQPQPQLNYSLAPQSMIGSGIGQQPIASQIHPLALAALQAAYRPTTGYGVPPGMGVY
jgi:hypothetical protein